MNSTVPAAVHDALVAPCLALSRAPALGLSDLRGLAERISLTADQRAALAMPDPTRPYGRRVILATELLEVMVATWTRGVTCNPHDHGGAVGGVKVLQGRARHRVWRIEDGALQLVREHTAEPGEILACGPHLIHSMGDDGAADPLMTLHLYTASIDFMMVYEDAVTHVVDGGCGAWVPHDQPALLRRSVAGIHPRAAVVGAP